MDANQFNLAMVIVSSAAGLIGVALGGWITSYSARKERRQAWLRRQLDEFYSPLLGMRELILAKSKSREEVNEKAGSAWRKVFEGQTDIPTQIQLEREHGEKFSKIIEYNNPATARCAAAAVP